MSVKLTLPGATGDSVNSSRQIVG